MCDGGERSHHLLMQAVQHQPKELLCVLLTALHGGWGQVDMVCVCTGLGALNSLT